MATLHIEHPVTDFGTWQAAFDRFAQVRQESGVCGHRILRPVDDAHYVSGPRCGPRRTTPPPW